MLMIPREAKFTELPYSLVSLSKSDHANKEISECENARMRETHTWYSVSTEYVISRQTSKRRPRRQTALDGRKLLRMSYLYPV